MAELSCPRCGHTFIEIHPNDHALCMWCNWFGPMSAAKEGSGHA